MPALDVQKIIHGTPEKNLILMHDSLVQEYTDEKAISLKYIAVSLPQSSFLEYSRHIFSEPQYGLPIYEKVISSGCVPFEQYLNEKAKVDEYVSLLEERKDQISQEMLESYKNLQNKLDELCKDHHYSMVVEQTLGEEEKGKAFCDAAYAFLERNGSEEDMRNAFEELSPIGKVLYATERAWDLNLTADIVKAMDESTCDINEIGFDDYANTINAINAVSLITQDKPMMEAMQNSHNIVFELLMKGFGKTNITDIVTEAMEESIGESDYMMSTMEAETSYLMESVADPFFEDATDFDDMRYYDAMLQKYIAYNNTLSYLKEDAVLSDDDAKIGEYSLVRDYAEACGINYDNLTISDAMDLMVEATGEILESLYVLEYTKKGEQGSVIKRHATDIGENNDAKKTKKSGKTDEWKQDIDDDDELDVDDGNDEDIPKGKPKMPKQSMASRIQSKALDNDVRAKTRTSKLRKLGSDVVQTGKAVLKAPGNVITGIKDIINGWKNMDDNRRKEYMLKPGYRKKCFKSLRWAIQYGLTAWISPLLIPITYFCRKASKEKNKYLQNELSQQLQTEIKVCEEKIQDASSRDDKQEKYKLMRIRDKLEAERVRVISNSKYV